MSEAKGKGKDGPLGRRNLQITNTAEEGELCIYTGHSIGRFSDSSMRYDSHQACTRCVAGAREGSISFNIDTMLKKYRAEALKLWSPVNNGNPSENWNWQACLKEGTKKAQRGSRRGRHI